MEEERDECYGVRVRLRGSSAYVRIGGEVWKSVNNLPL